ncbi:unnamed protein product, partial [Phaeothamnion confervicola]
QQLHDRVELLGAVPHAEVRSVLVRGHIFLNCSLTESFCIAIVEAACCGLFVVSTSVGGVPEVLPHSMIKFAEPSVASLMVGLLHAIQNLVVSPAEFHARVRDMYSWSDVAARTERAYADVLKATPRPLAARLRSFRKVGNFGQVMACFVTAALHMFWRLLEWLSPADGIEIAPDLPAPSIVATH